MMILWHGASKRWQAISTPPRANGVGVLVLKSLYAELSKYTFLPSATWGLDNGICWYIDLALTSLQNFKKQISLIYKCVNHTGLHQVLFIDFKRKTHQLQSSVTKNTVHDGNARLRPRKLMEETMFLNK